MSAGDLVINDTSIGEIIARAAGTFYNPKGSACIARCRGGDILAGVIYTNNVQGVSVIAHSAVFDEHGISRNLVYAALDYPFNQLKVKRIFGFVAECNIRAQVFNMKMGFKVVARIEGMFPHDDAALVMRLDRENARLLGVKPHGHKQMFN